MKETPWNTPPKPPEGSHPYLIYWIDDHQDIIAKQTIYAKSDDEALKVVGIIAAPEGTYGFRIVPL